MSRPVEVLRSLRSLAGDEGTVLVMDEKVADAFTAPGDEVERLMYTYSVLCCLPVGMAEQPSAATGTVMRTDTLRRYAQEAGFGDVEELDATLRERLHEVDEVVGVDEGVCQCDQRFDQ